MCIRITTFEKNTSNELAEVLKSIYLRFPCVKGLVLDLRDNPGVLLQSAVGVLSSTVTIIKPPKQYSLEQLMQTRKKAVMPVSNWQIIVDSELDFQLKYALSIL